MSISYNSNHYTTSAFNSILSPMGTLKYNQLEIEKDLSDTHTYKQTSYVNFMEILFLFSKLIYHLIR